MEQMAEFRVLPVRCGDAYLLKSRRGDYLFDGGTDGCGLLEMLEDRKIRKLRVAACSNFCRERIGGILELMEEGFAVTEYWFPQGVDSLLEMARRFNGDWVEWLQQSRSRKASCSPKATNEGWDNPSKFTPRDSAGRLEGSAILLALGLTSCLDDPLYAHLPRSAFLQKNDNSEAGLHAFFAATLEQLSDRAANRWHEQKTSISRIFQSIGRRLFLGGTTEDLAMLCGRLLLAEADLLPGGEERGVRALVTTLALTVMTGAMMAKTPARVCFMVNAGRLEDALIPRHPIKCLNGYIANDLSGMPESVTPRDLVKQTRSITGHRDGLVYQYGDGKCSVLLCGDSKLPFFRRKEAVRLDRPTVIAAPRQGGPATERAYAHIRSSRPEKDVWVRTHYSTARQISTLFKSQVNKICLNNCHDLAMQEILLRHEKDGWHAISGGNCVCG